MEYPSYSDLFDLTRRRLKGLKSLSIKNNTFNEDMQFLFLLSGNVNLRLNTILHLLNEEIDDGVFPLLRTLFEIQLAFDVYCDSDPIEREKYRKVYQVKKVFESANKIERAIKTNTTFNDAEKEIISGFKNNANMELKSITSSVFKTWYEIVSKKTTQKLSLEKYGSLIYYMIFDEPSNWVHSQRLDANLDTDNFTVKKYTDSFSYVLLIGIIWSVDRLSNNLFEIAKQIHVEQSKQLFDYGEKMEKYCEELKKMYSD